ncbi:hypothetical protein [Serratia liquefaciens]|uniref:hypothetical protein n=1 Tax=Serratia liquefaciens TaxID=614 RepID=UPI0021C7317D|nr:hypothetical protein [Serratia liquefaciens]
MSSCFSSPVVFVPVLLAFFIVDLWFLLQTYCINQKPEEVTVKKIAVLLTNQNYLACVASALVFMITADASHLRDSFNYGLQAVLAAKAE